MKYALSPAAAVLMLLASCQTMPEARYADILDWLPGESDVVVRFSPKGNDALAEILLAGAGAASEAMAQVRDRMALLAIGLEFDDKAESADGFSVHLAAIGTWPRGVLGSVLGAAWKKTRPYQWRGPLGWELAAVSRDLILVSRGRIENMVDRWTGTAPRRIPGDPDAVDSEADLAVWVSDSHFIDTVIPSGAGRISGFSAALTRSGPEAYFAVLNLEPSEERFAAPLALALRIALSARFGMSDNPDERALLADASVDVLPGIVRVELPSLPADAAADLLTGVSLFGEESP